MLLQRTGEAWRIHPLGGAPALPFWRAEGQARLHRILLAMPDGGTELLGGPASSRHEALRRAGRPADILETYAIAEALHPDEPGLRLQRAGTAGLVLVRGPDDAWRSAGLHAT